MAKAKAIYTLTEKVFLYPGDMVAWHFVPITKSVGQELKAKYGPLAKGFGSLPVEVTLGQTTWRTSIFPDKYSGSYLLPLKASVRNKEEIEAGEKVEFTLKLKIM